MIILYYSIEKFIKLRNSMLIFIIHKKNNFILVVLTTVLSSDSAVIFQSSYKAYPLLLNIINKNIELIFMTYSIKLLS